MYKKDIDSLLKKGKHHVCQYVTAGCYDQDSSNSLDETRLVEKHLADHDHRRINQIIDHLFDFRQDYSPEELVEWIKYLICGRRLPNNFTKEVKLYNTTSKCGLVWINNFVAYRCRTCSISLCMSLCADCFLNGDHKQHDFNMFRSTAGGACDCGDPCVMKPEGFCPKHRKTNQDTSKKLPPNSLLCIANEVIPRLFHYLVLYFRECEFSNNKKANALVNDILIYLCDLGTLMQTIICKALIDENSYNSMKLINKEDDLSYQHRLSTLSDNYRKALQEIELPSIIPNVENNYISDLEIVDKIESFNSMLKHRTYLDEIIFWAIVYEFPSNLITFLLKMLPNEEYKTHFADCFVKHYFRIMMLLFYPIPRFHKVMEDDISHNRLVNAVVHISVQLFSNEMLALQLCEKFHLLYIIILSLKFALCGNKKDFWGIVQQYTKFNTENSFFREERIRRIPTEHYVVNCDDPILRYHRFWPLISDLNNLFAHRPIAFLFLNDDVLISTWFELLMIFQGMNINFKFTKADDTNQNYKFSYLAELEICSSHMWTLVSHLHNKDSRELTINFIWHSLNYIKEWLRLIHFDNINQLDVNQCTFHLPLHRYYSVFMNHAITKQEFSIYELLPDMIGNQEVLKSIMAHPLQTLIVSYQITANMWIGPHIKTQALNYIQPYFCSSTIDADLFLVQQIAGNLDPDEFVEIFFQFYGLHEYLNLIQLNYYNTDKNKLIMFLENGFGLFTTIVGIQQNLNLFINDITRKEIVALLSVSDKTHSQIQDMVPYRWGSSQNNTVTEILNEVAEYKTPEVEVSGSLVQGYFYPKNNIWRDEYDPLFVLHRNQRREFQASLERFSSYAKQSGKYESNSLCWPPFRILPPVVDKFVDPRSILNSKSFHAYLFSILYRAINDSEIISQHLMSIIVYLIEMILIESFDRNSRYVSEFTESDLQEKKTINCVKEFEFDNWYQSHNILINFITIIQKTELDLKNDKHNLKTKIIASLFNSVMPDDRNPFNDGNSLIRIANKNDKIVINSIETDNEDSNQPVIDQLNIESISPLISLHDKEIENDESSQENDSKHFDDNDSDTDDDSSSSDSQESTSKQLEKKHLINIKIKPFKFQMNINESILTLLLKLHSKLSERHDSFKTNEQSLQKYDFNVRFGDGPYFIGCLLKRFIYICAKSIESQCPTMDHKTCLNKVIEFIDKTRQTIWPTINISPMRKSTDNDFQKLNSMIDSDELQCSEKRQRALERKQQIMNKFHLLQNEFLNKTSEEFSEKLNNHSNEKTSENCHSENENLENSLKYQPKTYQCVICMDFGTSILERPFVQIVLLQSSSILNNTFAYTLYEEFTNKSFSEDRLHQFTSIPITNEELCMFKERKTFAYYFERKIECLSLACFVLDSWLSSFNIGWCGGVHAQSCGHFMHMDCYQSYISSVYQNRDSNDLIEYSCPLCRKMANSVLPIIPNLPNFPLVQSRKNDSLGVAIEILNLLSNCDQARLANTTDDDSKFLKVLAMAIEDVMKVTEPQYRNIGVDPCPQSLFLFLSSISRTNLEYNIVLWRNMLSFNENASCLVPLFHALSLNAKLVLPLYYMKLWSQITGVDDDKTGSHLMPYEQQVPLLIKDVSAILLQFLYALPFNIDEAYFLSIVQALLNLNFIQAIVMVTFLFTFQEKLEIKTRFESHKSNIKFESYLDYIGFIINSFDATILNSSVIEIQNRKSINKKLIIETLAKICLPFLRISSMIFHLLFNQPALPNIHECSSLDEFSSLANYLCLKNHENSTSSPSSPNNFIDDNEIDDTFFKPYINWICNPSILISSWYSDLNKLMQTNTISTLNLIQESCVLSSQPKLLHLPKIYEELFMFYHTKPCETCNNVPKDPSLCLICGRLICIRENCCRTGSICEGVRHSRKCGAGTAIYLAINSSAIILIRGRKACVWGSVYLDEYGEEDRDLKRGKPLFLCEKRYKILEQQWLMHRLLNINKKWVYHKDSL